MSSGSPTTSARRGATLHPPIRLTFTYHPALIPEGVAEEDLAVAIYNAGTGQFELLTNIVVDTADKTFSGNVSHFTLFAVVSGETPPPVVQVTPQPAVRGGTMAITLENFPPSTVVPQGAVTVGGVPLDVPGGTATDANGSACFTAIVYRLQSPRAPRL